MTCISGCQTELIISYPPEINDNLQSIIRKLDYQPTEAQIIPDGLVKNEYKKFIVDQQAQFMVHYEVDILYLKMLFPNIPSKSEALDHLKTIKYWLCDDIDKSQIISKPTESNELYGSKLQRALRFVFLFTPSLIKYENIEALTKSNVLLLMQPISRKNTIVITGIDPWSNKLHSDPILNHMLKHRLMPLIKDLVWNQVTENYNFRLFIISCALLFYVGFSFFGLSIVVDVLIILFYCNTNTIKQNNIDLTGLLWVPVINQFSQLSALFYLSIFILFKSPNNNGRKPRNLVKCVMKELELLFIMLSFLLFIVPLCFISLIIALVYKIDFFKIVVRSQAASVFFCKKRLSFSTTIKIIRFSIDQA